VVVPTATVSAGWAGSLPGADSNRFRRQGRLAAAGASHYHDHNGQAGDDTQAKDARYHHISQKSLPARALRLTVEPIEL
jgi:hypothetical protein